MAHCFNRLRLVRGQKRRSDAQICQDVCSQVASRARELICLCPRYLLEEHHLCFECYRAASMCWAGLRACVLQYSRSIAWLSRHSFYYLSRSPQQHFSPLLLYFWFKTFLCLSVYFWCSFSKIVPNEETKLTTNLWYSITHCTVSMHKPKYIFSALLSKHYCWKHLALWVTDAMKFNVLTFQLMTTVSAFTLMGFSC